MKAPCSPPRKERAQRSFIAMKGMNPGSIYLYPAKDPADPIDLSSLTSVEKLNKEGWFFKFAVPVGDLALLIFDKG